LHPHHRLRRAGDFIENMDPVTARNSLPARRYGLTCNPHCRCDAFESGQSARCSRAALEAGSLLELAQRDPLARGSIGMEVRTSKVDLKGEMRARKATESMLRAVLAVRGQGRKGAKRTWRGPHKVREQEFDRKEWRDSARGIPPLEPLVHDRDSGLGADAEEKVARGGPFCRTERRLTFRHSLILLESRHACFAHRSGPCRNALHSGLIRLLGTCFAHVGAPHKVDRPGEHGHDDHAPEAQQSGVQPEHDRQNRLFALGDRPVAKGT